jgi:hypothetical protein
VEIKWKEGQITLIKGVTKGWLKSTETITSPPAPPASSTGVPPFSHREYTVAGGRPMVGAKKVNRFEQMVISIYRGNN